MLSTAFLARFILIIFILFLFVFLDSNSHIFCSLEQRKSNANKWRLELKSLKNRFFRILLYFFLRNLYLWLFVANISLSWLFSLKQSSIVYLVPLKRVYLTLVSSLIKGVLYFLCCHIGIQADIFTLSLCPFMGIC